MEERKTGVNIRRWGLAVTLLVVCVAVWHGTLSVPFDYDDIKTVRDNAEIRDLGNCGGFLRGFFSRGLLKCGYAVNYAIAARDGSGTPEARSFHVVNLILHTLNSLLVYLLAAMVLDRCFKNEDERNRDVWAFCTALLFCVHPIHTSAVNMIASRAVIQSALFSLGSLVCFTAFLDMDRTINSRRGFLIGTVLCVLCSVGSKSVGVAVVGLGGLLFYYLRTEDPGSGMKRSVVFAAMGGAAAAIMALLAVSGEVWQSGYMSPFQTLLNQSRAIMLYLRLLIWPSGLCIDHDMMAASSLFEGMSGVTLPVLALLAVTGLWSARKKNMVGLGILWFLIALAPSSSIIPRTYIAVEYRAYLALAGFSCIAVVLLWRSSKLSPSVPLVVCIGAAVALSAVTISRNKIFADPVALWSDAVVKSPQSFQVRHNLGNSLYRSGRVEDSVVQFREALEIRDDFAETHNYMGVALSQTGRTDEGIRHFAEAIRLDPNYVGAYINMGMALLQQGKKEAAQRYLDEADRLTPQ